MEFNPRDEVVAWANKVLDQHADHLAILDTHAYLNGNATRLALKPGKANKPTVAKSFGKNW